MKYNILKTKFIALLALMAVSCSSYIDEELNVDPNKPASVPVNALTPQIAVSIADLTGGEFSRFNCMLTQQIEGVERQWTSFNQYTGLTPNRFDTAWTDLYENVLIETDVMITQSEENGFSHYQGIGEVLKAYSFMMATDVWGDIPYTESGQGLDFQSPVYDDQATIIYPAIFALLDDALANFNATDGGFPVGSDDVFYGGDIEKWKKAARAIRARGHLHQGNYASALTDAQAAFTSRDDNMRFNYSEATPGPYYRFNDGRTGDLEFHPFMDELMTGLNDTVRRNIFGETFVTDHPYFVDAFGQDLISFREVKFIEAECLSRTGGSATAISAAYLAGILASFEEVGLTSAEYDAYVAQASVNPGGALDLEDHILTQKYIGLFIQPEVFNDYRRTGFPNITPVSGTQVPVRWNYSSDELLFNENTPGPSEADLFQPKVDWDN